MILTKMLLLMVPFTLAHEQHVVPPDPPCNCLGNYRPVCGVHNTTHINRCIADCMGDRVNCEGECPCKPCTDDTGEHQHGEWWKCPDGCNTCFCMNGMIGHTLMACLPVPDLPSGACTDDTGEYQHGESWTCPDGCNTCSCVDGIINSTEMACQVPDEVASCVCTREFDPVCGEDRMDYSNKCMAECEGAVVKCKGRCPCPDDIIGCMCIQVFDPVCGDDEMDYSNKCMAECEGAVVKCKGRCPCPSNNSTDDTKVVSKEPKMKGCSCPDKSPVCGVDGRTYPSRCQAECEEVDIECEGECVCIK